MDVTPSCPKTPFRLTLRGTPCPRMPFRLTLQGVPCPRMPFRLRLQGTFCPKLPFRLRFQVRNLNLSRNLGQGPARHLNLRHILGHYPRETNPATKCKNSECGSGLSVAFGSLFLHFIAGFPRARYGGFIRGFRAFLPKGRGATYRCRVAMLYSHEAKGA